MVPFDAYAKAFVAAFAGMLAIILARAGGRPAALRLSAFLFLIALNSVAEAFRAGITNDVHDLRWFRVASVAAALDPLALFLFVASYPAPNALARSPALWLVLLACGGLALYAGWWLGAPDAASADRLHGLLLTAITIIVYAGLLVTCALRWRDGREGEWRFMVPALAIAALPPMGTRLVHVVRIYLGINGPPTLTVNILYQAAVLIPLIAALIALLWIVSPSPEVRRSIAIWGGVAFALAALAGLAAVLDYAGWTFAILVGRTVETGRWFLFGTLASGAVFRESHAQWGLGARRQAARILVGGAFVFVVGLALSALGQRGTIGFAEGLVLLAALVLSQGFRQAIDAIAFRAYKVPLPGDPAAAHALYRAAASRAIAEGRALDGDPDLGKLRHDLAIDAPTARLLERLAEEGLALPLARGRLLAGRYRIGDVIGRGTAGRAFRARDVKLERDVVVKEILRGADGDEAGALREARLAGGLQHPNIIGVHDAIQGNGVSYLIADYQPGGSLAGLLATTGKIPFHVLLPRLTPLVEAVGQAHAEGIVHRDIKPENILVGPDGRWLLADFGIALAGGRMTVGAANSLAGTPRYMAPEQRLGARATPATDVYALGLVAQEASDGRTGREFAEIVERATAEDPALRWADARKMGAALRRLLPE